MTDVNPLSNMEPYLRLVDEASARVRRVIYVMVVASTLIASAAWNYRPASWDNQKADVVGFAAEHLGQEPNPSTVSSEERDLFEYAKAYVAVINKAWEPNNGTKLALGEREKTLRRMIDDNYGHIKVPIIGFGFNPNDTALLGGFGLLIIVYILLFALLQQRAVVRRTFVMSHKEKCLPDVYRLMSMSQVLTVPPGLSATRRTEPWLNRIHKVLFVLPALVQGVVVYIDVKTVPKGWAISHFNTVVELGGGFAFLGGLLALTWFCFQESIKTDRIWKDTAREIEKMPAALTVRDVPGVAIDGAGI